MSAATSTAGPAVALANLEYATPATKRHGGGVSSSSSLTTTTATGTTGDTTTSSLTTGAAEATSASTAVPSTTMTMTTVTPQDDGKGTNSSGANNDKHVRFGAKEGGGGENQSPSSTEKSLPDITATEDASNRTGSSKSKRGLVSKRGRYVSPGRRVSSSSSAPTPSSSSSFHHDESVSAAAATVAEFKNFRSPLRAQQQQEGVGPTTSTTTTEKSSTSSSASNPGIPARSISADPSIADIAASPVKSSTTTAAAAAVAASDNAKVAVASTTQQSDKDVARSNSPLPTGAPKRKTSDKENDHGEGHLSAWNNDDRKLSPKREHRNEREQFVMTPTNFAIDYGKNQPIPSSFDTSNVLAWLHSPTANGLFSPGGYGSMLNTPRGAGGGMGNNAGAGGAPANVPWSPRTPTVSTSFFFSDAANLPRGENLTPTPSGGGGKVGGNNSKSNNNQKNGLSNIICISPLASFKGGRNGAGITTPMDFKDVFNSPREKNLRGLPALTDTPTRSSSNAPRIPHRNGSKDPSLDAVHLAEREVMEDEDLTVLLQLASNATPRGSATATGPVFRSPNGKAEGTTTGLQLPTIGGKAEKGPLSATGAKHKLDDKKPESGQLLPPQLGMKSSSFGVGGTSGPKEIYVGGKRKDDFQQDKKSAAKAKNGAMAAAPPASTKTMSSNKEYASSNPYSLPLHLPGQDLASYYGLPGGMPPGIPPGTGGSMRVVVGGPPPPPRNGKTGPGDSMRMDPNGGGQPPPSSLYHDYPSSGMQYPPQNMYPQYGGPQPQPPMGYPPYQSHYPPPPHMSMYGAQHPPPAPSSGSVAPHKKASKAGVKRSSPSMDSKNGTPSPKKRKSPGQPKKKNRSPQITDKAERQKAARDIEAINAASGGKNNKASALAAAIMRGVTMRPSGKWQAQLYFAGKSRYIGVFDTREKAALAYEIAREKLKNGPKDPENNPKSTENLVNLARKAAFEGVNEKCPKT